MCCKKILKSLIDFAGCNGSVAFGVGGDSVLAMNSTWQNTNANYLQDECSSTIKDRFAWPLTVGRTHIHKMCLLRELSSQLKRFCWIFVPHVHVQLCMYQFNAFSIISCISDSDANITRRLYGAAASSDLCPLTHTFRLELNLMVLVFQFDLRLANRSKVRVEILAQ